MTDESKRFHRSFVIVMVSDFLKNKETHEDNIFYMAERVDAVICALWFFRRIF